jgi:hypothetical protein
MDIKFVQMLLKGGSYPCLMLIVQVLRDLILKRDYEIFFIGYLSMQSAVCQVIIRIIIWLSDFSLLLYFSFAGRQIFKLFVHFIGRKPWQLGFINHGMKIVVVLLLKAFDYSCG